MNHLWLTKFLNLDLKVDISHLIDYTSVLYFDLNEGFITGFGTPSMDHNLMWERERERETNNFTFLGIIDGVF